MTLAALMGSVAQWAAAAISPAAKVVSLEPLRPGGSPWCLRVDLNGSVSAVVLKTGSAGERAEIAAEAAALALAEEHGLPAPRLIACDLTGEEAGASVVLFTMLEGTAEIPVEADTARLRAAGHAAGRIHAVPLAPGDDLPLRVRHMPWIDLSALRREARTSASTADATTDTLTASTPLLDEADALLAEYEPPETPTVFVHGDLWQGNMMWVDDTPTGIIDWEAAGAGSYGVDLGALRLDAALAYGAPAPDEVLLGWEQMAGQRAVEVPYWDLVAALNTAADMTGFLPTMHAAGRTDLDGPTVTARRDQFIELALRNI